MAESAIEWTQRTWNPLVGCSLASPGCTNCYAMRMAGRLESMAPRPDGTGNLAMAHYQGTTKSSRTGSVWTGKVNVAPDDIFLAPLKRRKPTVYFVNSMSDLFHHDIADEIIDRVFAVMSLCPQHTFQVLTKRADRMRRYMERWYHLRFAGERALGVTDAMLLAAPPLDADRLTLSAVPVQQNVWLGVSVEDQQRANERVPDLLATPAAVRWLSCEPLLGPVDLRAIPYPTEWPRCDCLDAGPRYDALAATVYCDGCCEGPERMDAPALDWIVAGGESGRGARPMLADWARSLRDQCADAEVPFFFKQWGAHLPCGQMAADGKVWTNGSNHTLLTTKGFAGRYLDGIKHDAMPAMEAPMSDNLDREEFCRQFVAHMTERAAPRTHFDDGSSIRDYAEAAAPTYWEDANWLRKEGPEACADADMSYWGEE